MVESITDFYRFKQKSIMAFYGFMDLKKNPLRRFMDLLWIRLSINDSLSIFKSIIYGSEKMPFKQSFSSIKNSKSWFLIVW